MIEPECLIGWNIKKGMMIDHSIELRREDDSGNLRSADIVTKYSWVITKARTTSSDESYGSMQY